MVAAATTLIAWAYCSFSGKYHFVVVEVDSATRVIFEAARGAAMGYITSSVLPKKTQ